MKTLRDLNAQYLAMAEENESQVRAEYADMLEYSKHKASTKTDHSYIQTAFLPRLFRRSDFEKLSADIDLLTGILNKVVTHVFEDDVYRSMFHFAPEEEKLILQGRYERCFLPMARFDFFYDDETGEYKFCELGADGVSGMNEDRELHIGAQKNSSIYRKFRGMYQTESMEFFDSWVQVVCKLYREIRGSKRVPSVAIVDYMECATRNEFEVFLDAFRKRGVPAFICDVRDLTYDGAVLRNGKGDQIDVIYRRAVTADVLKHLQESTAMIEAAREDNVLLLGDFHTQIIHNKAISVMLLAEETFAFLTNEEIQYIKEHFPPTYFYTKEAADKVRREHTEWVLKPVDGYASAGVFVGAEYTKEEWEALVPTIPTENYIMQKFCEPYAILNYGETQREAYGKRPYHHLIGLFLYDCKPAGIYTRASVPKTFMDVKDEIALPTLIVDVEDPEEMRESETETKTETELKTELKTGMMLEPVTDLGCARSVYKYIIENTEGMDRHAKWAYGMHPNDALLEGYVDRHELFFYMDGDKVAGVVAITLYQGDDYAAIEWDPSVKDDEVAVLHILAVCPDYQRKGVAGEMMQAIMEYARARGKKAVRLDTLITNIPAQNMYKKLGFSYRGKQYLYAENTGWIDFLYYEFVLG